MSAFLYAVFLPLLVGVVVATSGFAHQAWQKSVSEVAIQLGQAYGERIEFSILNLLAEPARVVRDSVAEIEIGISDPQDLTFMRRRVAQQVLEFDSVAYVYYGREDGDVVGFQREDDGTYTFSLRDTEGNYATYAATSDLELGALLDPGKPYDVTARPWYRAAADSRQVTWTDIYVWFGRNELCIDVTSPVYDDSGQFIGVMDAGYTLGELSSFLSGLQLAANGEAFIFDPDGLLVASSVDAPLVVLDGDSVRRAKMTELSDPLLSFVGNALAGGTRDSVLQLSHPELGPVLVSQRSLAIDDSRQWTLAVAIPESDLTTQYQDLSRRTLLVTICAILATIFTILIVVRRYTEPLTEMNKIIERRRAGDYEGQIPESYMQRRDEIGAVARSLWQDLEHRRSEFQMLKLTRVIAQELDLNVLLPLIAGSARQLLNCERSSIFLFDAKRNVLWTPVAEGTTNIEIAPDEGVAGNSFTTRERINIPDTTTHPLFSGRTDALTGFRTLDLVCEPLITRNGDCIGVMQVLNRKSSFGEREEKLFETLASQAVVAIEKAQLFSDVLRMKNANQLILNNLGEGVVSVDRKFDISQLNPAANSILGNLDLDIIGRPITNVVDENSWVIDSLHRVAHSGQSDTNIDRDLRLRDGRDVSVNSRTVELKGEDGEGTGYMLILSDISTEKRVRGTMARYLPKKVVEQLLEADEGSLGGTSQEVTTLFSDIRDFTTIAESIGPKSTVALLNEYFTEMMDVLEHHDGILDKYIGDAVMAIFGAPFPRVEDADNALATAHAMLAALDNLNARRLSRGEQVLSIGIGLNTGEVVVGNIGSPKRMDYTVIGDPVNLAARLEGVTKRYGVDIVLSQFTLDRLTEPDLGSFRELDRLRVKGKNEAVPIYESLSHRAGNSQRYRQSVDCFAAGLKAYRTMRWDEAEQMMKQSLELRPDDKAALLYLDRIATYRTHPPPDDWDGIFTLTTK